MCLSGDEYIELLPAQWRKINDYGIRIDYRTYDCPELGPYRRRLWEVHYDPYDLSHVWVRDHRADGWITVPWTRLATVPAPFADFTWRHARALIAARGGEDTDEAVIAAAVDDLLHRATTGPDRRVAARTLAAAAMPMRPPAPRPSVEDSAGEPDTAGDGLATVIPFGVFDAFTDGTR